MQKLVFAAAAAAAAFGATVAIAQNNTMQNDAMQSGAMQNDTMQNDAMGASANAPAMNDRYDTTTGAGGADMTTGAQAGYQAAGERG